MSMLYYPAKHKFLPEFMTLLVGMVLT